MKRTTPHVDIQAINDIRTLIDSMSKEIRVALELDGFDLDGFQLQANDQAKYQGIEAATVHAERILKKMKEDIDNYHERQKRIESGLTITNLLTRYQKLPSMWRSYIQGQMEMDLVTNKNGEISDATVFRFFGAIAAKEESNDSQEIIEYIEKFDKVLREMEILTHPAEKPSTPFCGAGVTNYPVPERWNPDERIY